MDTALINAFDNKTNDINFDIKNELIGNMSFGVQHQTHY